MNPLCDNSSTRGERTLGPGYSEKSGKGLAQAAALGVRHPVRETLTALLPPIHGPGSPLGCLAIPTMLALAACHGLQIVTANISKSVSGLPFFPPFQKLEHIREMPVIMLLACWHSAIIS